MPATRSTTPASAPPPVMVSVRIHSTTSERQLTRQIPSTLLVIIKTPLLLPSPIKTLSVVIHSLFYTRLPETAPRLADPQVPVQRCRQRKQNHHDPHRHDPNHQSSTQIPNLILSVRTQIRSQAEGLQTLQTLILSVCIVVFYRTLIMHLYDILMCADPQHPFMTPLPI